MIRVRCLEFCGGISLLNRCTRVLQTGKRRRIAFPILFAEGPFATICTRLVRLFVILFFAHKPDALVSSGAGCANHWVTVKFLI
jgi:hypothetical protein